MKTSRKWVGALSKTMKIIIKTENKNEIEKYRGVYYGLLVEMFARNKKFVVYSMDRINTKTYGEHAKKYVWSCSEDKIFKGRGIYKKIERS